MYTYEITIIAGNIPNLFDCSAHSVGRLLLKSSWVHPIISKIDMKTVKCKYICEFIMTVFNLVEEDYEAENLF